MGRDHRHQPVLGLPCHPRGAAQNARQGLGPHRHDGERPALNASPFKAADVAAKHGIVGLTKAVALETAAKSITVNAICPGYVWTPLVERQIPDTMKARKLTAVQVKKDVMLAAQPTKEFVTVEEIASVAVFLCSDAAKNITGALLLMDGGWLAA